MSTMNTMTHMLAAGIVIAMSAVPSHGDIQLGDHGAGVFVLQEDAGAGDSDWSSIAQLGMGTVVASAGSDPVGTAWAGLDWLEDGTGFQITHGFEHGDINNSFISFQARMESMIRFVLDEPMQVDYAYERDIEGNTLFSLDGAISFFSEPGGWHTHMLSSNVMNGAGGLILGPGVHRISTDFVGMTYEGMEGSGEMTVDMVILFTPLPAPGALALLGLAGCAAGRRRRRE